MTNLQHSLEEVWKDIPGWEGYYQISNIGRIKSVKRLVPLKKGGVKAIPEKILKLGKTTKDYRYIILYKDGIGSRCSIHRTVLTLFKCPPPFPEAVVMHKDDNPANNRLENLSWGTVLENVRDCLNKGRKSFTRKIRGVAQFSLSGNPIAEYSSMRDAMRATGIHESNISTAIDKPLLSAGGFRWKFTSEDIFVHEINGVRKKISKWCKEMGINYRSFQVYMTNKQGTPSELFHRYLQRA